jgi:hypothetical protein
MRVIDEPLLNEFRGPGVCEWCRRRVTRREPHHVYARGMGGGGRLDVRANLAALCAAFTGGDDCHDAAHAGRITKDELIAVVARREGIQPGAVRDENFRHLRAPKADRPAKPRKAKPAPKRQAGPRVAVACAACGARAKVLVADFVRGRSRCACGGLHDRLARAS